MSDVGFNEVVDAGRQSSDVMFEMGGLPEIERASVELLAALEQTRQEIADAVFASRFSTQPTGHFRAITDGVVFTPRTQQLVDAEGEAGHKRAVLEAGLNGVEADIHAALLRLVELRCDLQASQTEF